MNKKHLPYSAHNSRGQKLGDIVDGNAIIANESIKVFCDDFQIMFSCYNDPCCEVDSKKWTLNKLLARVKEEVLKKLGEESIEYTPLTYVICDSYFSGIIYQIGNYPNEDCFRVYAITNGMA